jgi:choline dehydrogenase-like flavoprotein
MAPGVDRYDVVVIGSGFGGSVAALRLTEKGYRVGVLEAGARFDEATLYPILSVAAVAYGTVGALVASRHPRNPVGWAFCVIGLGFAGWMFTEEYAVRGLLLSPGALPAALLALLVDGVLAACERVVTPGGLAQALRLINASGDVPWIDFVGAPHGPGTLRSIAFMSGQHQGLEACGIVL